MPRPLPRPLRGPPCLPAPHVPSALTSCIARCQACGPHDLRSERLLRTLSRNATNESLEHRIRSPKMIGFDIAARGRPGTCFGIAAQRGQVGITLTGLHWWRLTTIAHDFECDHQCLSLSLHACLLLSTQRDNRSHISYKSSCRVCPHGSTFANLCQRKLPPGL